MYSTEWPKRLCNGGIKGPWCGKEATIVCINASGLQWYACEDKKHRDYAVRLIPIKLWWKAIGKGDA